MTSRYAYRTSPSYLFACATTFPAGRVVLQVFVSQDGDGPVAFIAKVAGSPYLTYRWRLAVAMVAVGFDGVGVVDHQGGVIDRAFVGPLDKSAGQTEFVEDQDVGRFQQRNEIVLAIWSEYGRHADLQAMGYSRSVTAVDAVGNPSFARPLRRRRKLLSEGGPEGWPSRRDGPDGCYTIRAGRLNPGLPSGQGSRLGKASTCATAKHRSRSPKVQWRRARTAATSPSRPCGCWRS